MLVLVLVLVLVLYGIWRDFDGILTRFDQILTGLFYAIYGICLMLTGFKYTNVRTYRKTYEHNANQYEENATT